MIDKMCKFAAGPMGAFTCGACGKVADADPDQTVIPPTWRTVAMRGSDMTVARAVCSPGCAALAVEAMWFPTT